MPEHEYKHGDVVKLDLASGSPHMTVEITVGQDVYCQWFGTDGTYHRCPFHADHLIPVVVEAPRTVLPAPPHPAGKPKVEK